MQDTELSSIKLREAVEAKLEKKLETNKDFEKLSNCLLEEGYDRISPTTLKRIWGYLSEDVTPRRHTLNQLSRFAGYADYDAFCSSVQSECVPPPPPHKELRQRAIYAIRAHTKRRSYFLRL